MIGDQEANGSLQIKSGKPNTTKYMNIFCKIIWNMSFQDTGRQAI